MSEPKIKKTWETLITPVDNCPFKGWVCADDFDKLLSDFELTTTTKFIIASSESSAFGDTDPTKKRHNIRFEDSVIPYSDGVPYMVVNTRRYFCQHGPKRMPPKQQTEDCTTDHVSPCKKRRSVQTTYKFDCPAKIVVKEVVRFPDFKIAVDTLRRRRTASIKVRTALASDCKGERIFFVTLPEISEHKNHHVGEGAEMLFHTDKRIVNKIFELVATDDVREVSTMRNMISLFVGSELFKGEDVPNSSNRRFWPTDRDLRNHMYRAVVSSQCSKHDQGKLEEKVKAWRERRPTDSFLFRPSKVEQRDNGEDDAVITEQGLLLVHQSEWQRRMLRVFGSELCSLDATFKTTKHALPLFFLCVRTNAGFQVAAEFVVQKENPSLISEALDVLKEWNVGWSPSHFATDLCESSRRAVESSFRDAQVLMCDFRREQCWERWCSNAANNVKPFKEDALRGLRQVAEARTEQDFLLSVQALQESAVWKSSEKLQKWFETYWLPQYKHWVWAFRKDEPSFINDIKKDLERQDESFKSAYLQKNLGHSTLSNRVTFLIEDFLPERYKSYVAQNTSCSPLDQRHHSAVPTYLNDRPRDFAAHCMERISESAYAFGGDVRRGNCGEYQVRSSSAPQTWHTVSLGSDAAMPQCSCSDFKSTRWLCKHFFALFRNVPEVTWDSLGSKFRNHPLINLDCGVMLNQEEVTSVPARREQRPITAECSNSTQTDRPPRTEADSSQTEAELCRDVLVEIKRYTYLLKSVKGFREVKNKLKDVLETCKSIASRDNGQTPDPNPNQRKRARREDSRVQSEWLQPKREAPSLASLLTPYSEVHES